METQTHQICNTPHITYREMFQYQDTKNRGINIGERRYINLGQIDASCYYHEIYVFTFNMYFIVPNDYGIFLPNPIFINSINY